MMENPILKFLIVFVIFSFFLGLIGVSQVGSGFAGFQTALADKPTGDIPGATSLAAVLQGRVLYMSDHLWQVNTFDIASPCDGMSVIDIAPGAGGGSGAANLTPNPALVYDAATTFEVKDLSWEAGWWNWSAHFTVANNATESSTVTMHVKWAFVTIPNQAFAECSVWGNFNDFDVTVGKNTSSVVYHNASLGAVSCDCGGAGSLLNGGAVYLYTDIRRTAGNQTVFLVADANSRMAPPDVRAVQPGALENIANFFANVVAWIGWGLAAFGQFFGGLFLASFSGDFGPFGVIMGLFLFLFIATVFIAVVYWIRGTSGSLGV